MNAPLLTLDLQFRRQVDKLIPVEEQLSELFLLAQHVSSWSPLLSRWFLTSSKSKEEALLYKAFDSNGPTAAAIAVLREKSRSVEDVRSVSVWNGQEAPADGASMSSTTSVLGRPDRIDFQLTVNPVVGDWRQGAALLQHASGIWPAAFATFSPFYYPENAVFKDRPGVGWMLYLPHVLTAQQVPEARALVPVIGKNAKGKGEQRGTIIVSVTDEPFSDENPEHVRNANAIEIRLVDQDLLPRYADL
jgi:hypothetical protein